MMSDGESSRGNYHTTRDDEENPDYGDLVNYVLDGFQQDGMLLKEENTALPALVSIWDCPYIKKTMFEEYGKMISGWTCG
jgi:hypothetical protein